MLPNINNGENQIILKVLKFKEKKDMIMNMH